MGFNSGFKGLIAPHCFHLTMDDFSGSLSQCCRKVSGTVGHHFGKRHDHRDAF